MPISDFLANVGGKVGEVGRIFGGQSDREKVMAQFVHGDLPVLKENLRKATTFEDMDARGDELIDAALKAGVGPKSLGNLVVSIIKPAMEGLQRRELDKIGSDYAAKTTPITPMVAPEGQGQPLPLETSFEPQTQPARNPMADPEGAMRMFRATGARPETAGQFFRMPGQIAEAATQAQAHEASRRKTEQAMAADEVKTRRTEEAIAALPQEQQPMARLHPAGLVQFQPERPGPLDDIRRSQIEQQTRTSRANETAAYASAEASRARAGAASREGRGSAMMQDYIRQGGDPRDQEAFAAYVERLSGARRPEAQGSETEVEAPDPKKDFQARLILEDAASKAGINKLPPEQQAAAIKKLAQDLGYDIEGTPKVGKTGYFGFGDPTVTGITGFKRKPKVTTKNPGGKGKQDNTDPLGIRPKK